MAESPQKRACSMGRMDSGEGRTVGCELYVKPSRDAGEAAMRKRTLENAVIPAKAGIQRSSQVLTAFAQHTQPGFPLSRE